MLTAQQIKESTSIVKMNGICKSFSGVKVLKNVNFDLRRGEVHALVGENGAGKSTLMNILMGILTPEQGEIIINGEEQPRGYSIDHALKTGVTMIPQELALVPAVSVAENIMMSHRPKYKSGAINWKKLYSQARYHVEQLGFDFDVTQRTDSLPIAYRQLICIIKAIAEGTSVIIMDEPTSSLSAEEVTNLHSIIRKIAAQGTSIIYISHYIDEIFAISDRVTVMRDGENVGTYETGNIDQRTLISMMVGEELLETQNKLQNRVRVDNNTRRTDVKPILEVCDLKVNEKTPPCSFEAYAGEVIGIAGLVGAGKTEIAKSVLGIAKYVSGQIRIKGEIAAIKNPIDAYRYGFAIIPEDRKLEGLCLLSSAEDNIALIPKYRKTISKFGVIQKKKQTEDVNRSIEMLSIKTERKQRARKLSGGNQQKLVLAKALLTKPEILILDEPTRGIDVGAKGIIYELIRNLRDEGMCVILCSSDVEEVSLISDRILVLRDGKIVKELHGNECSVKNVLNYAAGEQ